MALQPEGSLRTGGKVLPLNSLFLQVFSYIESSDHPKIPGFGLQQKENLSRKPGAPARSEARTPRVAPKQNTSFGLADPHHTHPSHPSVVVRLVGRGARPVPACQQGAAHAAIPAGVLPGRSVGAALVQ